MDKKVKKEIRSMVKGLPAMDHLTKKVLKTVSGESLMNDGQVVNKDGVFLEPFKRYTIEVPEPINHQTRGEEAYKHGGFPLVARYCEEVQAIYQQNPR